MRQQTKGCGGSLHRCIDARFSDLMNTFFARTSSEPLTRRGWLGAALTASGCLAAGSFARGADEPPAPTGYTRPGPAPDHGKAPGMQVRELSVLPGGETTYAVVFAKGDEVLSGLTEFAVQKRVTSGYFTGIGAFQQAKLGWFDAQKRAYRDIPVDQQVELVSLVGNVGMVNGKPQVHTHASVALPDGTMRGGHVLEAVAWPTVEVFLTALPLTLIKETDPETGLSLFDLGANP